MTKRVCTPFNTINVQTIQKQKDPKGLQANHHQLHCSRLIITFQAIGHRLLLLFPWSLPLSPHQPKEALSILDLVFVT